MTPEQEFYAAVQAMVQFGGSFVSALGRAGMAADATNRARLREAFPEYFAEYRDLAARTAPKP